MGAWKLIAKGTKWVTALIVGYWLWRAGDGWPFGETGDTPEETPSPE